MGIGEWTEMLFYLYSFIYTFFFYNETILKYYLYDWNSC